MLSLPEKTECNVKISKQKFYEKLSITPAIKRMFVDQIQSIYWVNKISPETINIDPGENVKEIQVFQITLNQKSIDEKVLNLLDKEIPYHLLFVLRCNDEYQLCIAYKHQSKVKQYFYSDWYYVEPTIRITGFNLDDIYENWIRIIAGDKLADIVLEDAVLKYQNKLKMEKEIERLDKLARKEVQPKKKFEYVQKINQLIIDLED